MQANSTSFPIERSVNTSILIVDDEPDIVTVFKKSLEMAGYSTYGFVNSSAALEHFKQNLTAYQIIISDVRMPGISGIQLAREVRKISQDVKIILMSSFEMHMPEFNKVLPSIKIDAILDKPIALDRLVATIKTVEQ